MIYYEEACIPIENIAKVLEESQDYCTAQKSLIYNKAPELYKNEGVFWRTGIDEENLIGTFRHYNLFDNPCCCKRLQDGTALIWFTPELCAKLIRDIHAEMPEVMKKELCSPTLILATDLMAMYWFMRVCLQVYRQHRMEHDNVFAFIFKDPGDPDRFSW